MTLEEKVKALGAKLGNIDDDGNPRPETGVYEILTNQGTIRKQYFWNGSLEEYTKPDGSTDVQLSVSAEATAADIAAFQG